MGRGVTDAATKVLRQLHKETKNERSKQVDWIIGWKVQTLVLNQLIKVQLYIYLLGLKSLDAFSFELINQSTQCF